MLGSDKTKPMITDGITNIADYVKTMPTNPNFERPMSRMTPISNVLVSTDMSSSE